MNTHICTLSMITSSLIGEDVHSNMGESSRNYCYAHTYGFNFIIQDANKIRNSKGASAKQIARGLNLLRESRQHINSFPSSLFLFCLFALDIILTLCAHSCPHLLLLRTPHHFMKNHKLQHGSTFFRLHFTHSSRISPYLLC